MVLAYNLEHCLIFCVERLGSVKSVMFNPYNGKIVAACSGVSNIDVTNDKPVSSTPRTKEDRRARADYIAERSKVIKPLEKETARLEIGRASCRERV